MMSHKSVQFGSILGLLDILCLIEASCHISYGVILTTTIYNHEITSTIRQSDKYVIEVSLQEIFHCLFTMSNKSVQFGTRLSLLDVLRLTEASCHISYGALHFGRFMSNIQKLHVAIHETIMIIRAVVPKALLRKNVDDACNMSHN